MSNVYDFFKGDQVEDKNIHTDDEFAKRVQEVDVDFRKFIFKYFKDHPNRIEEVALVCVAHSAGLCKQNKVSEERFLEHAGKVYRSVELT